MSIEELFDEGHQLHHNQTVERSIFRSLIHSTRLWAKSSAS
jgi:hypothetical protein